MPKAVAADASQCHPSCSSRYPPSCRPCRNRFGHNGISLVFDVSVWEIWGALLHGGRLVVVPESVASSPVDLHGLLVTQKVTVLSSDPFRGRHVVPRRSGLDDAGGGR